VGCLTAAAEITQLRGLICWVRNFWASEEAAYSRLPTAASLFHGHMEAARRNCRRSIVFVLSVLLMLRSHPCEEAFWYGPSFAGFLVHRSRSGELDEFNVESGRQVVQLRYRRHRAWRCRWEREGCAAGLPIKLMNREPGL